MALEKKLLRTALSDLQIKWIVRASKILLLLDGDAAAASTISGMAARAGTSCRTVELESADRLAASSTGEVLFLGREIVSRIQGTPDLPPAGPARQECGCSIRPETAGQQRIQA